MMYLLTVIFLAAPIYAEHYPNGYNVATCRPPAHNGGKLVYLLVIILNRYVLNDC